MAAVSQMIFVHLFYRVDGDKYLMKKLETKFFICNYIVK